VLFVSTSFLLILDGDSLTFSDGFPLILLRLGFRQPWWSKFRLWKTGVSRLYAAFRVRQLSLKSLPHVS